MRFLNTFKCGVMAAVLLGSVGVANSAQAYEPFIGEVRSFGFNFCPRSWAAADGQLLPISSYTALFSLYGTTYGGDGRTTFALPDLRGRVPMHVGTGPGLTPRQLGEKSGQESTTLLLGQTAAPAQNGTTEGVVSAAGDRGAVNVMQPYTVINWCVALEGVFPSRN